jgi:hypothetical protein
MDELYSYYFKHPVAMARIKFLSRAALEVLAGKTETIKNIFLTTDAFKEVGDLEAELMKHVQPGPVVRCTYPCTPITSETHREQRHHSAEDYCNTIAR